MTHMRRAIAALVVVAAVVALLLVPDRGSAATTRWTVDGYTIQVNGQPFFAKGVCYFPLPLGNASSQPPYGDYFYNFPGEAPVTAGRVGDRSCTSTSGRSRCPGGSPMRPSRAPAFALRPGPQSE